MANRYLFCLSFGVSPPQGFGAAIPLRRVVYVDVFQGIQMLLANIRAHVDGLGFQGVQFVIDRPSFLFCFSVFGHSGFAIVPFSGTSGGRIRGAILSAEHANSHAVCPGSESHCYISFS